MTALPFIDVLMSIKNVQYLFSYHFCICSIGICTVDFISSRIGPVDTVSKGIEVQCHYVAHFSVVDIGGRDALRTVQYFHKDVIVVANQEVWSCVICKNMVQ